MTSHAFGLSDKGRVRQTNEDAFACMDALQLFVVADGMGGHSAGDVASRLAVDEIVGFLGDYADTGECSWPCGIDPQLSFDGNRLRTALHLANRRVFRAAKEQDDCTGMATTVVSALVTSSKLVVGHVGDSRLYLWADGSLERLTVDDAWAMTILAEEVGTDTAALAPHRMRNVLTNVLGAREQTEIHLSERPLNGGELLLLCSDGLHSAMPDADIAGILSVHAETDLETVAESLVNAAIDRGSRDNVTAVLVHCLAATS